MKCQNKSCEKQPAFCLEPGKSLVCSRHQAEGISDVIQKTCPTDRFEQIQTFDLEEGKPLVCLCHLKEGMIDVITHIHKRC